MDRTLLVQRDTTVKVTGGTQKIQVRFAVVALVRVVDLGLSENEHLST